jgi:hypothetical protein
MNAHRNAPKTPFLQLLEKIIEATKAGKLDAPRCLAILQSHGCPSFVALKEMAHLIPDVNDSIDAAILGLH